MFDEPTRDASQRNLIEGGNAFAGRGGDLNEALRNLNSLAKHGEPAARNLADPQDRLRPPVPRLRPGGQRGRARRPAAGRALRRASTRPSPPGARSPRSCSRRSRSGPRRWTPQRASCPPRRRSSRNSTELFRRFRPAFAELAAASPDLADAFGAGTASLRRSSQLNGRLVTTLAAAGGARRRPARHPGAQPPHRDRDAAEADPRVPHACADQVQLLRLVLQQPGQRAVGERHGRQHAALRPRRAAAAARQRGRADRGRRPTARPARTSRRSRTPSCTATPTPTRRRRGRRRSARPTTRSTRRAPSRSATSRAARGSTPRRPARGRPRREAQPQPRHAAAARRAPRPGHRR